MAKGHALAIYLENTETEGSCNNRESAENDYILSPPSFYKDILDNCREFIYRRCLFKDEFDYISPYFGELTGFSPDEYRHFQKEDFFQLIHPEDRPLIEKTKRISCSSFNKRVTQTIEYRIRKKDGSYAWVSDRTTVLKDKDGNPDFVIGNARDITEERVAKQALKESEEQFAVFMENLPNCCVFIKGNGADPVYANKCLLELFGTRSEWISQQPKEVVEAFERKVAIVDRSVLQGDIHDDIEQLPDKNGQVRTYRSIKFPLYRKGKPTLLGGIGIDITEQVYVEQEVRKREAQYRSIFESSLDGLVVYDFDGIVIEANPAACNIFGYAPGEMMGLPVRKLVHPEERELYDQRAKKHPVPPYAQPIEVLSIKKDESVILIEMKGVEFEYKGRKHALGIFRDITERKSLEKQLTQAQKMEALGTLAGGIAHDFNNLLMAIQGHISLLQLNTALVNLYGRHFEGIEEMVRRGASLTQQFLSFANGGKYEVTPTDVNGLISKTVDLFGRTKKELSLHERYQKNICTADIDRGQIEQVVMNLLVNAWQAMPEGGAVYIQTEETLLNESDVMPYGVDPGKYVAVAVTDTGLGMDEDTKQRIFEPFFTTKEIGKGTGLGLASTYGIIKNHGGFISVDSEPGAGTTFTVFLPASKKKVPCEKPVQRQIVRGTGTILLVDDEEMVVEVGRGLLTAFGYDVLTAGSGPEALDILKTYQEEIDLVILDMIMPGMSGGDLHDGIKRLNPQVKTLLSSGYSVDGQAADILNRGCSGFLQKPFKPDQLSRKIREILDGN